MSKSHIRLEVVTEAGSEGRTYGTLVEEPEIEQSDTQPVGSRTATSRFTRCIPLEYRLELMRMVTIAIPVILTNLLQFSIPMVCTIMCGHLDKLQLDGVALANSLINGIGLNIGSGMVTACDTLFAQTFGSADKKRTGMFLQRSLMIITLAPLFTLSLHVNMEPILIFLGQDKDVVEITARYLLLFAPGLFFHHNYLILARYMQNQDLVRPPVVAALLGNLFNIVSQYVLLYQFGFDFRASAICEMLSYFLMWLFEVVYILVTRLYVPTWDGWKREALYDWRHFLSLAIPGIGHVALETVAWEVTVFLAGILGATELAAQSILMSTETVLFMIPAGLGTAANITVGQYLGAGKPQKAKTAFYVALSVAVLEGAVMCIIYFSLQDYVPYLFTNDLEVAQLTTSLIPVMTVILIIDHITGVCGGGLRGCGRQKVGAIIIFCGFIAIGLPLGSTFAFVVKLGALGLWLGIIVGVGLCSLSYIVIFKFQNWEEQAAKAQERVTNHLRHQVQTQTKRDDERTSLCEPHFPSMRRGHVRTPSQPVSCSIEFPSLPAQHLHVSRKDFRRHALQKAAVVLCCVMVFIAALTLHFVLPRESYWPVTPDNSTLTPPITISSWST